jgi:hypothetical protein
MQTRYIALALSGILLLASCGGKDEVKTESIAQETRSTSNDQSPASNANVEQSTSTTTTALAPAALKGFMPSIPGFKPEGGPDTLQARASGTDYSVVTQKYLKGDKKIKIVIADYNGVPSLTAGYNILMNTATENETEVTKGETFSGRPGWVSYHKDHSRSQIGIAVNDRIWLIAEGENGVTIDALRSVIKSMDLGAIGSEH